MKTLKKYLFLLPIVVIGLIIPTVSYASNWITNLVSGFAFGLGTFVIVIFTLLTAFCLELAGFLLRFVLSPNFITMSYTNPATNDIIKTGLAVTQGLVNMILVLILIYIAIATILRLQEYQAQKLLPTFIIIALLVNFTPVICGIIVDASNILMNFFVSNLPADSFGGMMAALLRGVAVSFGDALILKENIINPILQSIVVTIFMAILTIILLIFTAVFVMRHVAIWLLVILSPIAFIAYILPITRKYWTMWWQQFLSWCFVGATCGFFLYLSFFFMMGISRGEFVNPPTEMPGIIAEIAGDAFRGLIPYYVGIAFLLIGLVVGLKTSAMGASTVISAIRSRGEGIYKGTYKWAGKKAVMATAPAMFTKRVVKPRLERRVRATAKRISDAGAKLPTGLKWLVPEGVRKFGEMRPAIENAVKKSEYEASVTSIKRVLSGAEKGTEATARILRVLSRGDGQDIFNTARGFRRWRGMNDQEILKDEKFNKIMGSALSTAQSAGMLGPEVLRKDPRLSKIAARAGIKGYGDIKDSSGNLLTGEKLEAAAVVKTVGESRSQHIANWEPEVFDDPEVIKASLAKLDRDRWLQVGRTVKNGKERPLKNIDSVFKEFKQSDESLKAKSDGDVWKNEFRQYIKDNYGGDDGYFVGLGDNRMTKAGWREGTSVGSPTAADATGMGAKPTVEPVAQTSPHGRSTGGAKPSKGSGGESKGGPKGRKP